MKFVESVFDKFSIQIDIPIESASFSDIIQELFQKFGGVIIGIIIVSIVLYVASALFLNKLNKMVTGSGTILAWIPLGRTFLCGKLAQSTGWGIFILLFPVLIYNWQTFKVSERVAFYVALGYLIIYVVTIISLIVRFFTCLKDNNNAEYINYKANQIASGNIDPNEFVDANGTMSLTKKYIMQSRLKNNGYATDYDRNRPVHSSNYKNKQQGDTGHTTNVFMEMVEGASKQGAPSQMPAENFDDTVNESKLENTIPVIVFKNKNNGPKPMPNMPGGMPQQMPQPFQHPAMNQINNQFVQNTQGQVVRRPQPQMVRQVQPQVVQQPQQVVQPAQPQMVQPQLGPQQIQRNQYKVNQQQNNNQPFGRPIQPQMIQQPQGMPQQMVRPVQQSMGLQQTASPQLGQQTQLGKSQVMPQQGVAPMQPQMMPQQGVAPTHPQMMPQQGVVPQMVRPAQSQMIPQQGIPQQVARPVQPLPQQQGLGQNPGNGLGG